MKVIISGAGRGGTNLLRELVDKITDIDFTTEVEDRNIDKRTELPKSYGTKLATENGCFTIDTISRFMDKHEDLYIIFSLRHPIDNCLSKIVRGQKSSDGGDKPTEILSSDATVDKAVGSINFLYITIDKLKDKYPNRIITVKMEDVLLDTENTVGHICKFLGIDKPKTWDGFQVNNKNRYQKNRYGNNLDKGQINLFKDTESFNGFFKGKNTINEITNKLGDKVTKFYDL
jgi:hypothetical protein